MKTIIPTALVLLLTLTASLSAQVKWKRQSETSELPLQLFHSMEGIILPTTETMQKGDIEFEVSHRFIPTVNTGTKNLFGFDGPAYIKLALSYAFTDNFYAGLSRSNKDDNLELFAKYRFFQLRDFILPVTAALRGGAAWNTQPMGRSAQDNSNFQYYGQLVLNTMINKKLGIGIVPSFIYNTDIYSQERKTSITLGTDVQYYITPAFSVLAEYNPTISGLRNSYDSFGLGFELETGGHFFKIVFTNNDNLNTSQYLGGSDLDISPKNFRIGFNITRRL